MLIAIFDLDRTLTRQPTFTPFLIFGARRIAPIRLALLPLWVVAMLGYRAGLYSRTALKTFGMRLLLGSVSLERLERLGREFARSRTRAGALMAGTMRLLEEHRAAGARLVMATAAFEFYARAFGDSLGFDTVIATQWDGSGIPGGNCYGAVKSERVSRWAQAEGIALEEAQVLFVSDSFADAPLLDRADVAIFATSSESAASKARDRGWEPRDLSR